MKSLKKVFAVLLCVALVAACFSGCSKSGVAEEITDKTMLIAYTEENKPFLYKDKDGKFTGFEVEIMEKIFDNVKNDFTDYQFVQVEEGYRIGEDTAYTDEDGNRYVSYVMIGGLRKDTGAFNEDYSFTESIVENKVITVTAKDSKIATYADMSGAGLGYVNEAVVTAALDKHSAIVNSCKSVTEYSDIESALKALDSGKITALVTGEFTFNVLDKKDNYKVLKGELDTIGYVIAFEKYDWIKDSYNEAIYQLKSPDYNNEDELTPIVEKYFGYNASSFSYEPEKK